MLNATYTKRICTIQDKIISCFSEFKKSKNKINTCYKKLNILKFSDTLNYELCKFMFKIKHNMHPDAINQLLKKKPEENNTEPRYNTRQANIPNIKKHTSKHYNCSFMSKSYTNWTKLTNTIKSSNSIRQFKKNFNKEILTRY